MLVVFYIHVIKQAPRSGGVPGLDYKRLKPHGWDAVPI